MQFVGDRLFYFVRSEVHRSVLYSCKFKIQATYAVISLVSVLATNGLSVDGFVVGCVAGSCESPRQPNLLSAISKWLLWIFNIWLPPG